MFPRSLTSLSSLCLHHNLLLLCTLTSLVSSLPSPLSRLPPPCRMEVLLSEPDERQFLMNPLSECSSSGRAARENINTTSRVKICCPLTLAAPSSPSPSPLSSPLQLYCFILSFLSQHLLFNIPDSKKVECNHFQINCVYYRAASNSE